MLHNRLCITCCLAAFFLSACGAVDAPAPTDAASSEPTSMPTPAPTAYITLDAGAALEWPCGIPFSEPGFTAYGADGADISAHVTCEGKVDCMTPGYYSISYYVCCDDGCSAAAERCVNVVPVALPKTAAEENDTGSYGSGAVGALLGSVAGAIVWALIFLLGRIAAIGGIVIAWLSAKGYDLLHGKQGKGKIVIVLILSLLGVLLGTFGGYYAEIVKEIVSGELAGYTVGQVPGLIATLFLLSPEFKAEFIKNLAIGFVIAAVGIFLILKNTHDGLKGSTIKDLP